MDLGHRIVAMVEGAPKRVLCLTCNTEHNYREPKNLKRDGTVKVRTPRESTRPAGATGGVRAANKARTENQRYELWASKALGKAVDAFTRYSMERTFRLGELVMHPKFGEGYVDQVMEDGKVNVMFREGAKVLAHK